VIATLAAPSPDPVALLIVAVVVLAVAYVLLFEIGLPMLRQHLRERRYGGYVLDRNRRRLP
jgi:hypothetical protein